MRSKWACPDIPGSARPPGRYLVVPGSQHEFPECPEAFNRTAADVATLRVRRGGEPFAEHLIGGQVHPISIVGPAAMEVRNGARTLGSLPTKVRLLVGLYEEEVAGREAKEDELREEERRAGSRR